MVKKFLVLVLVFVLCLSSAVIAYAAEDNTLNIELNGKSIGTPAYVLEGELFLPLRVVSEGLGFDVQWSQEKKEISVSKGIKKISLYLSNYQVKVNDHESYLTSGYRNVEGRTYLRQDFFSDNLGLKVTWDKAGNKVTLQEIDENPIVINTKKEISDTKTLDLTLQYPELQGLANAEVQNKLNSLFEKLAADAKNEGLENEKYIVPEQIARNIKAETYFNYQVKYNWNGLLSIVFSDYQYRGGAHGLTVQSSYTFDLKTGAELKIKDLFKSDFDYISMISSEVKKQMGERGMTVLLAPFNSIKADQDFYLSNNAVVVYFQAYEYLPYAYGIPEFYIDFQLVDGSVDPKLGL